jgi:hypothetical protein
MRGKVGSHPAGATNVLDAGTMKGNSQFRQVTYPGPGPSRHRQSDASPSGAEDEFVEDFELHTEEVLLSDARHGCS